MEPKKRDITACVGMFESLLEQNAMTLFYLDGSLRIVRITPSCEHLTGYGTEEFTGKHFGSILFRENDFSAEDFFKGGDGGPVRREVLIKKKDSSPVRCFLTGMTVPDGTGQGYIGVIMLKQQPDPEMETKIGVFTMAVEQSPATVVITDRHGSIEYVNPKFTRLTGYSFNEALRHNPRILKSGEQPPEFYRELWNTITSGKEWRGDFHNKKKNGELYWESASISPIRNDRGEITHFVAVKEDVTDRKRAEEEIRVAGEALKRRNDEMSKELANAQMVTAMLLPSAPPVHERLLTAFRFRPLDAVGGDFFSFNTLHEGGMGVFIGDVAGHGVSAALFLTLLRSLTDRMNALAGTSPSQYIQELNHALLKGGIYYFMTALYGFFDFSGKEAVFRFAKGGHTPPILYRAGTGTVVILVANGIPVGLSETAGFQEIAVDIRAGDRIYLYTDGIIEMRNDRGDMIELEGLRDIIARSGGMGLKQSLDYIMDEAGRFQGSRKSEDDIVLVGFEVIQ